MDARRLLAIGLVAGLLASACASNDGPSADGITVVATTTILGDIVAHVVGDAGTVEVLMPTGADPHEFTPSSRQVAAIAGADLVVENGLDLEQGLQPALDAAAADGVRVLAVAPLADPLPFDSDDGSGMDPHVWLDPLRVAAMADAVAEALADIDPTTEWAANAAGYRATLVEANRKITEMLLPIPPAQRKLVTNHDALGYFADRYGFSIVGVVIPGTSSIAQPSSADIARLIDTMREEGVNVIFAETSLPTGLADAVAAELGESVSVVELHTGSLGAPGTPAEDLVGMLVENARLIAEALQ